MYAKTKVVKSGNSWSIRLSKEALAFAGLKPGQELFLEVRPGRLILRKPRQVADHKLDHAYKDAKVVWEQALKEIVETRRELSKRLDRIEAVAHETRADLRDAEDRIEKLESKPAQ